MEGPHLKPGTPCRLCTLRGVTPDPPGTCVPSPKGTPHPWLVLPGYLRRKRKALPQKRPADSWQTATGYTRE